MRAKCDCCIDCAGRQEEINSEAKGATKGLKIQKLGVDFGKAGVPLPFTWLEDKAQSKIQ